MVKSHVRLYELPRRQEASEEEEDKEDDFGLTLRGDCPVYIRSVDFDSPAHELGLRSGDLLLEVNGKTRIDYCTKYICKNQVIVTLCRHARI